MTDYFVEKSVLTINGPAIYDELLDLVCEGHDFHRLKAFRLSAKRQARVDLTCRQGLCQCLC